jgi:uncharacterized protein (DUF1015 family)
VTDVRPFRALRYDPARVDLSRVLAPVYDVVGPEERAVYWERDPHNAVRLELTRDAAEEATTDYTEAAGRLRAWRREGVLVRDAEPALYVLRQRFATPDGRRAERLGFFGALRLEDYAARVVRPHERTLAAPKADRLKLLRATRANLSSVFLLYEDREGKLAPLLEAALQTGRPQVAVDTGGVENALAPLLDPAAQRAIQAFLAERPVVIADGHHRYETALAYRDEQRAGAGADREAPAERLLAYFANAFAPGSLLLPIHRLVLRGPAPDAALWGRLEGWERREVAVGGADAVPAALEAHLLPLRDRHAFAADDGGGRLLVFSRPRDAEVSVRVVHREVLAALFGLDEEAVRGGAVAFPKSAREAAREVRAGRGAVALYLNALAPEEVFRVTEAGETLPQKSTFFHPKLATGLLFRALEPDA